MTTKSLILTCSICLVIGLIFFAYMQEIIIIRRPLFTTEQGTVIHTTKKEVPLSFWHNNTWQQEKKELLWHENLGTNVQNLINNLLKLLEEEHIKHKKASVQSVLIAPSGRTAYVSFDRVPYAKEDTTYDKWLFIEGILKTVKKNTSGLDAIQFLVNHTAWVDQHLDFSKGWPLDGFYKELQ